MRSRWQLLRLCILVIAPSVVLAVLFAAFSLITYGSLEAGLARMRGATLFVDQPNKVVGPLQAGQKTEVAYRIQNVSGNPITIMGARTSCGCITSGRIQLTIQPRQTTILRFQIAANGNNGRSFVHEIDLLLDQLPGEVRLTVAGREPSVAERY